MSRGFKAAPPGPPGPPRPRPGYGGGQNNELILPPSVRPTNDLAEATQIQFTLLASGGPAAVLLERLRQANELGFDTAHDAQHVRGELAWAAAALVMSACRELSMRAIADPAAEAAAFQAMLQQLWPWPMQPLVGKGARADLVRAGALILAEISRLDALEAATRPPGSPA
jgi:hypothetical protein